MAEKKKRFRTRFGGLFLLLGIGCLFLAGGRGNMSVLTSVRLPDEPESGLVLRIGVVGNLDGLQPATIRTEAEKLVGSLSFEALTYYDQEQQALTPLLAESWSFSEDAHTLTFQLKKEVRFHNGRRMTAADVKKSWEKSLLTNENWENAHLVQDIVGSTAFFQGTAADISGIEAKGNELRISFAKPNVLFPYIITNPLFWVADAETKEGIPAGTGAYQMRERTQDGVKLTAFRKYHTGIPKLGGVEVVSYEEAEAAAADFQAGKTAAALPLNGQAARTLEEKGMASLLQEQPLLEYYMLGFQLGLRPFAENTPFRQALNYMVDREGILRDVVGRGFVAAKGPVPQGVKAYRPQVLGYLYDEGQAADLLQKAGYTGEKWDEKLLLSYHTGDGHRAVLEAVQKNVENMGAPCQLREAEWNEYMYQLPRMGYSFFQLSWRADYPDADDFLYSLYHSENIGVTNYTGFQNPQVDALLTKARATEDEAERIHLQQQAEDIILDQAPQLWLFQRTLLWLADEKLEGFRVNVSGWPDWRTVSLRENLQTDGQEVEK